MRKKIAYFPTVNSVRAPEKPECFILILKADRYFHTCNPVFIFYSCPAMLIILCNCLQ